MNSLKTTFNGRTLCLFVKVDTDILVHLGNIDTATNRIYTTLGGYDLIATNAFKSNHKLLSFDEELIKSEYNELDDFFNNRPHKFRKFNVCVDFSKIELPNIISMCNRVLPEW